jgi:hypothetical protein
MYTVEDETFIQARAILSALARELDAQRLSGTRQAVDLHQLIRSAAPAGLERGEEADYAHGIADRLEKSFPIAELFPRKHRARNA